MSPLDALRRPEYTGENRCLPCTALNGALVLAAAAAAGRRRPAAGVATLVAGTAAVALRGYAVPYTPRIAPRAAAALPIEFPHPRSGLTEGAGGAAPAAGAAMAGEPDGIDGEELLGELIAAGAVEDGGRLRLAPSFRDDWESRMDELRAADDDALAAAAADAAPFEATGEARDGLIVLRGGAWTPHLARAVAVAETAAVEALADRGVAPDRRASAAYPLRAFLRDCPACGGPVVETTARDCCGGSGRIYGSPERAVLACEECGEVLYRFPADPGPGAAESGSDGPGDGAGAPGR